MNVGPLETLALAIMQGRVHIDVEYGPWSLPTSYRIVVDKG